MTLIEEIKNWLQGDRDYTSGIALLQRYGKNKILAAALGKAGKERNEQNHRKLAYELGKITGGKVQSLPDKRAGTKENKAKVQKPRIPPRILQTGGQTPAPVNVDLIPLVNNQPLTEYPPVIRRIKYEYAELYRKRDIQHKKMAAIPTENNDTNNQARAALLADVKTASSRMELLYKHLHAFDATGTIADENLLWPKPKEPEQLPNDATRLKLMKKNLQTANGKDRNLLEYQTERKGDKEMLMPDGPKRKKIEQRIKDREKRIAEIEDKLFELEIR